MSGSLVSASNGKVEIWLFWDNFTFYISDIILRGWNQVSADRGWSPYNKDSISGWQKSFTFLANHNIRPKGVSVLSVSEGTFHLIQAVA